MSLQLILGNSGSGKTYYLYDRVIQESMEHPERNYLIIVPEQFTMQTQKELVLRHPKGGIMNIDVLSFGRLAHRIFEEVGRTYGTVLDDEGKNLILRKIAGEYESQLQVIGKNLRKFGYISEVKSVISEFTQYDIGLEKIQALKEQSADHAMLSRKLEDISILYKGFYEYLDGKYITGEELLDKLSEVVPSSSILKDSVITFDGFTGFTPVQNRLIQELLQVSSRIYMTVTIDEKTDYRTYASGEELFGLSKETITNAMQLAKDCGVKVEPVITLFHKPAVRFLKSDAMSFLEAQLFRYENKKYQEDQDDITIHLLRNPEEESRWIAGEIKRLVRTKGYRYQDIAVIASATEAYATYLKRACEQYQIPVFSDQTRSILLNAFVEYTRSVLTMVEQNYTYESVFRFLKSGFGPMPIHQVDVLETYVLSRGIKGYKKWQEPWKEEEKYVSSQTLNYLNQGRVLFIERIQELHFVLKNSGKTVEDICKALYTFFLVNNMQQKLDNLEQELQEEGQLALAKEYSQIYAIILELLDKFVSLLGDEKVSLKEFNELLDAGIGEARVGVIPPSIDSVVIGDITRTRIGNIKVLFFVGANDAHLPGNLSKSGFLTERDRAWFSKEQVRLKPNGKEQMYIQKFYLYQNLTKPSESLYITLSKTTSEGKSTRPAYLLGEIRKLFPNLPVIEGSMELGEIEINPEVGLDYLIEGLRNPILQEDRKWKELYAWYKGKKDWNTKLAMLTQVNRYKKSQDPLTKEVAEKLYGKVLKNSVTRLEKFASCPYAHFLTYGLGLKERDLHEFEAVDLGNVFHEAIERYSKKVNENDVDWKEVSREVQENWANEAVEESVQEYEHALLYKSERDKYQIERMKRLMRRSVWAVSKQLSCGAFKPEGFEVAFGEDTKLESTHVILDDNQEMILRGKIDRVDICKEEGTTYVKVLDYKTGSKELSLSELYYGLQLQLFVYLNAAIELEKQKGVEKVVPAGVLYYRMDDPMVEAGEPEKVEASILEELTPDGLVNEGANVVKLLDHDFEGKSYAVPVSKDNKGQLKKSSKAISQEEFQQMGDYTNKKIKEIGEKIVGGVIDVEPYKAEKSTGCDYCKYKKICRFDSNIEGFKYREIKELNREEAMEKMKEGGQ